jgi:predicted dehydrogenase
MADQHLRLAVFGTGFWSNFQIPAWLEVGGVKPQAIYNRTVARAEKVVNNRCAAPGSRFI